MRNMKRSEKARESPPKRASGGASKGASTHVLGAHVGVSGNELKGSEVLSAGEKGYENVWEGGASSGASTGASTGVWIRFERGLGNTEKLRKGMKGSAMV